MRYLVLLLVLAVFLTSCATVPGAETTPTAVPPTETVTPNPTELPTQPATEEMTLPPETEPALSPEERALQTAKAYLNSRFSYLSGVGDEEILYADTALVEEIHTLRQTLIEEGVALEEGSFYFSGIEERDEMTVVYMWKSINGRQNGAGFYHEFVYRIDLVVDDDGNLVVACDTPASAHLIHEDGEAYMLQCVESYLQSRTDYLIKDGAAELFHVTDNLAKRVEEERQSMVDQGQVLVDAQYAFGDVFYEKTHAWVYVWKTLTYNLNGQETTEQTLHKLFVDTGFNGDFIIGSDAPAEESEAETP